MTRKANKYLLILLVTGVLILLFHLLGFTTSEPQQEITLAEPRGTPHSEPRGTPHSEPQQDTTHSEPQQDTTHSEPDAKPQQDAKPQKVTDLYLIEPGYLPKRKYNTTKFSSLTSLSAEGIALILDFTLFNYTHPQRVEEWLSSIQLNLNYPVVQSVFIFSNTYTYPHLSSLHDPCGKVVSVRLPDSQGRMLYADAFDLANTQLRGRFVIILNTDIFLGDGWEQLNFAKWDPWTVFALSRYNPVCPFSFNGMTPSPTTQREGPLQMVMEKTAAVVAQKGSHDAFLFRSPLYFDTATVAHIQNLAGSENVVCYELKQAGYTLLNPCNDLQILHHHCSGHRNYTAETRVNKVRSAWIHPSDLPPSLKLAVPKMYPKCKV